MSQRDIFLNFYISESCLYQNINFSDLAGFLSDTPTHVETFSAFQTRLKFKFCVCNRSTLRRFCSVFLLIFFK